MEWPLPLWQVLHEELRRLRPDLLANPDQAQVADWGFQREQLAEPGIPAQPAEIMEPARVASGIRSRAAIIGRLWPENSQHPNFTQLVAAAGEVTAERVCAALDELQSVPRLYKAFRDLPEHKWVARQMRKRPGPTERERARLNRYLLEKAFAGAIRPIDERILPGVVADLHRADLSALCFSGGGIRSATFGLGIVQGLAHQSHRLLDKFDYLSTVSGGGYLGAWLDAWTYHKEGGLTGVIEALSTPTGSKVEPEPDPLFYLRNFSNYLTPQKGLFSIDAWTLLGIYLRNLFLNWTIILPLLMAMLAIPYVIAVLICRTHLEPAAWYYSTITIGGFLPSARSFWAAVVLLGVASGYEIVARPSNLEDFKRAKCYRWFPTGARGLLFCFLIPLCASFALLSRYLRGSGEVPDWKMFVLYGLVSALLGWVLHFGFTRKPRWADPLVRILSGAGGGYLLYVAWTYMRPLLRGVEARQYILLAPSTIMGVFLATATVFIAFSSWWTDDDDREYWARMGAWMLAVTAAWLALVALALYSPGLLLHGKWKNWTLGAWGGITAVAGLISTLLSWSRDTPAQDARERPSSGWALNLGLPILGSIAIVGVLSLLALGNALALRMVGSWVVHGWWPAISEVISGEGVWGRLAVIYLLGLTVVCLLMGFFVDVNNFSLHGMYRNRLIRAYLGASRKKGDRKPNPLTGFDPEDNLAMSALWQKRPTKLMPVVNIALNLVEPVAEKLAWQERKAESFTVTPLHSGNFRSGYRRSEEYGGQSFSILGYPFYRGDIHAISLGTATAVSGAAVSPNMGYISSPVLTFLLALLNVRLGWWLGNPGPAGNSTFRLARPFFAPRLLIDEALGRTNDQQPYVYLSDGGHFENLGLYEMVLRRCHTILVIDADEDKEFTFGNLGNAIRKIRIDLGIDITFEHFPNFRKRHDDGSTVYCAKGRIHYTNVDDVNRGAQDGHLIYVKPTIGGDEPADVLNYETSHRDFPHQSTANQWFSESQFESYRALGKWEIDRILNGEQPHYREPATILNALNPH